MAILDESKAGNAYSKVAPAPKKPIIKKPLGVDQPTNRIGGEAAAGYRTVTTDPTAAARAGDYVAGVDHRAQQSQLAGITPSWTTQHVPAYGSGSGGGGGGGSAGGPAYDPAILDQLLSQYQSQYDTSLSKSRDTNNAYLGDLQSAYGKDAGNANGAYNQLDQYLSSLQNPYDSIGPASAAQVDPSQLANLIRSQGGGDAGLLAQAQFLQAQNGSAASASDRLASLLKANQASFNQGTQVAGKQARAQSTDQLLAQLAALRTHAQQGQASNEQALLAQLQQAQNQVALQRAQQK